jgi:hypothetical protein
VYSSDTRRVQTVDTIGRPGIGCGWGAAASTLKLWRRAVERLEIARESLLSTYRMASGCMVYGYPVPSHPLSNSYPTPIRHLSDTYPTNRKCLELWHMRSSGRSNTGGKAEGRMQNEEIKGGDRKPPQSDINATSKPPRHE